MLRFSKKVEYALTALLRLSRKQSGELTTARELSDEFRISMDLMSKILQNLAQNGLVGSIQGAKGGYYLLRSSREINVSTIISAIEGKIYLTDCHGKKKSTNCDRGNICIIREPVKKIQTEFVRFFDNISLKNLGELNVLNE